MTANNLIIFFIICVLIYLIGGLSSLFTFSVPKLSNRLSNTCAMIASGFLSILMTYKLIILKDIPLELKFNNNIPFLTLCFKIDNLAAFFILVIAIISFVVSMFSYTYMSHYFLKEIFLYLGFYIISLLFQ